MENPQVRPVSLCLWTRTPVRSIGFVVWNDRVVCGHLGEQDESTLVCTLRERLEKWATGNKEARRQLDRQVPNIGEIFDLTVRHDFLSGELSVSPSESRLRVSLKHFIEAVDEYLAGRRFDFFDILLDLGNCPGFTRTVLHKCREIPYGQTMTYRELATAIGRPTAVRAVAQALAHNPIPLLIPCHRVIGSDGSLRGYSAAGGTETKRRLIQMEKSFHQACGQ
ncbi:MAG: methylated-DNA--[protein]-cysteine S-methyltransferase [Thermogutta sp.]